MRIFGIQLHGFALDACLCSGKHILQAVLHGTHIAYHQVITGTDHIGHPVVNPEGGVPGEGDTIALVFRVGGRHDVGIAVDGGEDGHVGVIQSEPQHTADGIGQIGTHLGDEDKRTLLGRDGAFVEIFFPIDLERQRRKAVRRMERTGTGIFGDVEGGAFVMVAHGLLQVADRDFPVGLHIERHGLLALALDIGQVGLAGGLAELVEIAPYTGITETHPAEVQRIVGIGKAEVLVGPVKITFLAGKRNHVGRIHAVVLVVQVELADTALVGMGGNAVIGHPDSDPHRTLRTGTFADHFQNPGLVGVGYRERFASAVIAIFLHQLGHHLDGFLGRARTLQGDVNQAAVIQNAAVVHQFGTTAEGRFANRHLKLVHVSDDIVRLLHFLNLAQVLPVLPIIDFAERPIGMGSGRIMTQETEHAIRIGRIRHQYGAVGRGFLTDDKVGTSPTLGGCHRQQHHGCKPFFHHSFLLFSD